MAEEQTPPAQQTLYFVKNVDHNTEALENYLTQKGFIVYFESDIIKAKEAILTLKPQYIFLAWDHLNPEAGSINFDEAIIIPYITTTNLFATRHLSQITAPFKLMPPLSGPSIEKIIEKSKGNQELAETQKQIIGNRKLSPYLEKIPQQDKWLRFSSVGYNLKEDLIKDPTYSYFDSITDLTIQKPLKQFSIKASFRLSEDQKEQLAKKYDSQIKPFLEDVIETVKYSNTTDKKLSSYAILVRGVTCSGVVILSSEWEITAQDVAPFVKSWSYHLTSEYESLVGTGESIYQSDIFEIDLNQIEDAMRKSTICKTIKVEEKTISLSYFDLEFNPFDLKLSVDQKYIQIDKGCFIKNSTIPFDVYIELKENKKFIRYFKSATLITDKEYTSINSKGDIDLFIEPSFEQGWYKYSIENLLKQNNL